MSNTDKLITPFGEIKILIDGASFPYHADNGKSFVQIFWGDIRSQSNMFRMEKNIT